MIEYVLLLLFIAVTTGYMVQWNMAFWFSFGLVGLVFTMVGLMFNQFVMNVFWNVRLTNLLRKSSYGLAKIKPAAGSVNTVLVRIDFKQLQFEYNSAVYFIKKEYAYSFLGVTCLDYRESVSEPLNPFTERLPEKYASAEGIGAWLSIVKSRMQREFDLKLQDYYKKYSQQVGWTFIIVAISICVSVLSLFLIWSVSGNTGLLPNMNEKLVDIAKVIVPMPTGV